MRTMIRRTLQEPSALETLLRSSVASPRWVTTGTPRIFERNDHPPALQTLRINAVKGDGVWQAWTSYDGIHLFDWCKSRAPLRSTTRAPMPRSAHAGSAGHASGPIGNAATLCGYGTETRKLGACRFIVSQFVSISNWKRRFITLISNDMVAWVLIARSFLMSSVKYFFDPYPIRCRILPASRFVIVALTVFCASGCAISRQSLCGQQQEHPNHPCPQAVSTQGIGLIVAERHVAIGWMKELYLEIPDPNDCRLIILVKAPADLDAVADVLKVRGTNLREICTVHQ